MPGTKYFSRTLLVLLALALPGPSRAQVDRDAQEINSYVLTDTGLQRYANASVALGPLAKKTSGDCDGSDDSNPKSIDEMVAHFNAVPGAKAALQSAGMTTREYILFSLSIFQTGLASWGLSQPGGKLAPGVSMANVNFYRRNETAIAKLGVDSQSDDCGEEAPDDE